MSIKEGKETTEEMSGSSAYAKRWCKTNTVHKMLFTPPSITTNQTEYVVKSSIVGT
jgi:hypothetical protein